MFNYLPFHVTFTREEQLVCLQGKLICLYLYSKSPIYAVNWFRRFPRKLKTRVSRTVIKYDVLLTYIYSFRRIIKAKQVLLMKIKL
jgi:hypothetical protein